LRSIIGLLGTGAQAIQSSSEVVTMPACPIRRQKMSSPYVVALIDEQRSARSQPAEEITLEAILKRAGGKRLSPEEFDRLFGHLPTDGEG
jgi:hypothetical protein